MVKSEGFSRSGLLERVMVSSGRWDLQWSLELVESERKRKYSGEGVYKELNFVSDAISVDSLDSLATFLLVGTNLSRLGVARAGRPNLRCGVVPTHGR